jgi:peptidoglycan/LPS O-acetylase OafA/YrhL
MVKEVQQNFVHRVFHWIAERSYGIYLSHLIVLWFVFDRMTNFPLGARIVALAF